MKPREAEEIVSASPNSEPENWGGDLPDIPSSTGVFWPSILVGVCSALLGLYLVLTPVPPPKKSLGDSTIPDPIPSTRSTETTQPDGSRVLRCAFVDSKDSTFAVSMKTFAKEVDTRSQGRLTIELLPGGLVDGRKMGERDLIDAVRKGKLGMALSTTSPLTNFNHDLDVFDLPFLFNDHAHVDVVLDGEIGETLLKSVSDKGLTGVGYLEVGFRIFSTSIPLPDYASFRGKKLRVMQSVTFSRFIKSVGGDPVPAPVDKIYMMGQEGYIDGADRTYPTYWDFHLYDVHRFITETGHAYSVKMLLIDNKSYQSLEPDLQSIIRESAKVASKMQRKKQREADLSVKKLAKEEGIKIFEVSDAERKKFIDASRELYEEYRKNQSPDILEKIEEIGQTGE